MSYAYSRDRIWCEHNISLKDLRYNTMYPHTTAQMISNELAPHELVPLFVRLRKRIMVEHRHVPYITYSHVLDVMLFRLGLGKEPQLDIVMLHT